MRLPNIALPLAVFAAIGSANAQSPESRIEPGTAPGNVRLRVATDPSGNYGLESSTDLQAWSTETVFGGTGSERSFEMTTGGARAVFWRFLREDNGTLIPPVNFNLGNPKGLSQRSAATAIQLAANGIPDATALVRRFSSLYQLNGEVERLRSLGVAIDTGAVLHLIREVELRGSLSPLVSSGAVRSQAVDSLSSAGLSTGRLRALVLQGGAPTPSRMAGEPAPLDRAGREALQEINNCVREVGGTDLTTAEFAALRTALSAVAPLPLAPTRTTNQNSAEGRRLRAADALPGAFETRIIERTPPSDAFLPEASRLLGAARLAKLPLPLRILGTRFVDTPAGPFPEAIGPTAPFTEDGPGEWADWRTLRVNLPGIAWFSLYAHASGARLNIVDSRGATLIDTELAPASAHLLLLPILHGDVCAPYRIRSVNGLDITLVSVTAPEALSLPGGTLATETELESEIPSPLDGCGWYRFGITSAAPVGEGMARTLSLRLSNPELPANSHSALLRSPSGTVRTIPLGNASAGTFEFPEELGVWDLWIAPTGAFNLNEAGTALASLQPLPRILHRGDEATRLFASAELSPVRTRPFVIATLDRVTVMKDGEPSLDRAEVKLNLVANAAPQFQHSARFGAVFAGNPQYAAWSLWHANGMSLDGLRERPDFMEGMAAIRSDPDVLALLQNLTLATDEAYLSAYTLVLKRDLGEDWYNHLSTAEELYASWQEQVVQINAMKFPMGNRYNLSDSLSTDLLTRKYLHPVIPVNMPLLGVPKDRLAEVTHPISLGVSAVEMDELDEWDLVGSAVKGVINTGFALLTSNWADAVCSGVGMVDEMHATLEAAKDDPLGNATLRMNRLSSLHGFYGLEDNTFRTVHASGTPRSNRNHAFEGPMDYMLLACQTRSLLGGSSQIGAVRNLVDALNGDLTDIDTLRTLLIASAGYDPDQVAAIEAALAALESGSFDPYSSQALEAFDQDPLEGLMDQGTDVFGNMTALIGGRGSLGGVASRGQNLVRTNANFPFGGYDGRKLDAAFTLATVSSVPLISASVKLDRVEVFDPQESVSPLDGAEVFLQTRVGIIGDRTPTSWETVRPQYFEDGGILADNGGQGYSTVGATPYCAYVRRKWAVRPFAFDVSGAPMIWFPDGAQDPRDPTLMSVQWAPELPANAAALHVEIGVYEDDGDTCDDDMIGVFSHTFLLHDLVQAADAKWSRLEDGRWRLTVTDYPVFGARWLQTFVEIGTGETARQTAHNAERLSHPSAMISFHVDLELGTFTEWTDNNTYDLRPKPESGELGTAINPRLVARSAESNLDQLIAVSGTRALSHIARTTGNPHSLAVHALNAETPSLTLERIVPEPAWPESARSPFGDGYLHSALAGGGRFLVVLCEDSLNVFDLDASPALPPPHQRTELAAFFPSRLAVDADGSRVYVSLRKTGMDLQVYQISNDGSVGQIGAVHDIPRTVAGLIALPSGGLVVHAIGGLRQDAHGYGEDYWDNPEDATLGAVNQRFGNENHFLHYRWSDGQLVAVSALNLAGDVSESQMVIAADRHQSSMFRTANAFTLESRSLARPFSIGLDASGNFADPRSLNALDRLQERFLISRETGVRAGSLRVESTVPRRTNQGFESDYSSDPTRLGVFSAFTSTQMKSLQEAVEVSHNLSVLPAAVERHVVALCSAEQGAKLLPMQSFVERVRTRNSPLETYSLGLIDLEAATATRIFSPHALGSINLPTDASRALYIRNGQHLLVGAHNAFRLYPGATLASAPAIEFSVAAWSGKIAYSEANALLFIDRDNGYGGLDVYSLADPANPVLLTSLSVPGYILAIAWSELHQCLFVARENTAELTRYARVTNTEWQYGTVAAFTSAYPAQFTALAVDPAGNRLFGLSHNSTNGSQPALVCFSLSDPAPAHLWTYEPPAGWLLSGFQNLAISPSGQDLFVDGFFESASPYRILRMDISDTSPVLAGGVAPGVIGGAYAYSLSLGVTLDGSHLITSGFDRARAIPLAGDQALQTSMPAGGSHVNAAFSPDGERMAAVYGAVIALIGLYSDP